MQPEATTSFRSVLRNYIKAEPEKKAKYILGNFAVFISIVDSCEHSLKRTIKAERRYNRKNAMGDVGIRVQNSHIGDPTSEEATENIMLDKAFELGDLEKELKDTDCPEWHLRDAEIIEDMREDYSILVDVIHTLKPTEQNLLLPYLTYEKSLRDIADEAGILYESAAVKITRIRTKVRKDAANSLANKYSIYEEEN